MLYHIEQYNEDHIVVFEASEGAVKDYYNNGGIWYYGDLERFDPEGQEIILKAIREKKTRNSLDY